jgi:protoporphyrinogen oxidase
VVLTAPSPVVAQLCPQLSAEERRRHERIEYLGILCASVVLRRPLASYYVTNITDEGLPFTAVIEMTTLVDPAELGTRHLVYLPRYAAADDEAWNWTDHDIEERFLAALARMYPGFRRDDVEAFRVSRVKHVMALPTLGYSAQLPPLATSAANVYVVNSAHIVKGTLNVNEVLELAEQAFETVLEPAAMQATAAALPRKRAELVGAAPAVGEP